MAEVPEEVVVWEYIRWDGKYREWTDRPILRTPDFNNEEENKTRWDMLAGHCGFPGDSGQIGRIRYPIKYPFDSSLPPYRWRREIANGDLFEKTFLNYHCGDRRLLAIDEIVREFLRTKSLPPPFNEDNTLVVNENLRRLKSKENIDDFNAILFCRPTPGLPEGSYRVVEGTKRAIAYRAAQLEGIEVPEICHYLGDYIPKLL